MFNLRLCGFLPRNYFSQEMHYRLLGEFNLPVGSVVVRL